MSCHSYHVGLVNAGEVRLFLNESGIKTQYRKNPKLSDTQNIAVITLNFYQIGLTAEKCLQKMQME